MSKLINREALTKAAALVAPALSSQNFIPALSHIRFRNNTLTAYNDISALCVSCEHPLECLIPGDLLIKSLGALSGQQVKIEEDEDGRLIMSSGRSKIKLPTLPVSDFPLQWPTSEAASLQLHAEMIEGIARCLVSVGTNTKHPAQMGVTMDTENGACVLFSTDNVSLSRYRTQRPLKLPADIPLIMPRFFCEQVVALSKAFLEQQAFLVMFTGALQVDFPDAATVFSKTPVDLEPVDFQRMFNRHCGPRAIEALVDIPDSFDRAFERAALVLTSEQSKVTEVHCEGDSIRLLSRCPMGEADDTMPYDGPEFQPFGVDPTLVLRVCKTCSSVSLAGDALVLTDGSDMTFTHMIAHVALPARA